MNGDERVNAYCPTCMKAHRIERFLFDLFGVRERMGNQHGKTGLRRVVECRECNQGAVA